MNTLLALSIRAALAAGKDIMDIYDAPDADFGIEYKADNSPLTRADKAAHARIMEFLAPTGIPVLSEEGAHLPYSTRRSWQRLWIVDPLDGTKEFIKRNGEFTVNIALVEKGRPIMGVIYVPVKKELYYGGTFSPTLLHEQGEEMCEQGAWLYRFDKLNPQTDEETLAHVSCHAQPLPTPMSKSRSAYVCVASRSHLSPETEAFINNLRTQHPNLQLVSSGSSLKICLVAEGRADIYPRHAPTMEWDTAAGHALVLATGHEMVDAHTGTPLTYNKEDLHNPWFIVR